MEDPGCVLPDKCAKGSLDGLGNGPSKVYGAVSHTAMGLFLLPITNQIPEEYNQIITILSQKIGEGEGIDVQEWMDVVEAHVNVVDSKHGPREKREVTIANRANPNVSQNIKDNCFYCGEVG